ncbi:MAG: hypothetical protein MI674_07180, partial [Cytophagales bacterium]|nr:hypothetical protein [Cytophagales bacterium]
MTPEDLQEYSSLAHIQATPENRRLRESYFNSLCNKIKGGQYGETPLIEALEYTLQNIDSDVFEGNPSTLIWLGKDLLAKLDPSSNKFTKATYSTHRSTLYALHQTLVLIQLIDPSQWDEGIYSQFKEKVEAIAGNANYYPFRYHALLLDQILQRLKSEEYRARLKRMRIVDGLRAGWAVGQAVVSMAAGKLDIDALKKIYESLKAAFAREGIEAKSWYDRYQDIVQCIHALEDIRSEIKDFLGNCKTLEDAFASEKMEEKTWYDCHQAVKYASILSLGDSNKYSVFEQGLEALQKAKLKNNEEGRKALCFGIVQQLRLLALHGPTEQVRKQSIQWLEDLAKPEAWGGDAEVMEGLLDGLAIVVHSQGEEKEVAQEALKSLTGSSPRAEPARFLKRLPSGNCFSWGPVLPTALREVAAREAIQQWLGKQSLEEKLRTLPAPAASPASGGLFSAINSALKAEAPGKSPATAQEARHALREYYQHPDFAQVPSLFAGEEPKHVDSLQCQLMLLEQVKVKADCEGQQDHLSTHHERLAWVKNPIALEDLFNKEKHKARRASARDSKGALGRGARDGQDHAESQDCFPLGARQVGPGIQGRLCITSQG